MRDGNTAALGQRVGVGIWLAFGATLAFLAVQTVLVTGEATIVTDLGAPSDEAGLGVPEADSSPILPVAAMDPDCGGGSDCADGSVTNGTTGTPTGGDSTPPGVSPADLPNIGDGYDCGSTAGAFSTPSGIEFSDIDPCSPEIEARRALCTFVSSNLGWGAEQAPISMSSPLANEQTASSDPLDVVLANEGTVYEFYTCDGQAVTFTRTVYSD